MKTASDYLTIRSVVQENKSDLKLRIIAGREGLDEGLREKDLHRPGLFLAGFEELFPKLRIQLIGNTETLFLQKLSEHPRRVALEQLFNQKPPAVIITAGNSPFSDMIRLADKLKVPLLATKFSTNDVTQVLAGYLNRKFAPNESIHGTLVDVYGTGMLFLGRAGIGKSEIALDLIERGHRLVADDVVQLSVMPPALLIGAGPELLRHFIEIRGVGIINVREVFGVRAIRLQKRVELVVELEDWDDKEEYERLGMVEQHRTFLGQKVPLVKLPIYPGKNITVIAETIALNHHLKVYGYHAAKALNKRLLTRLRDRKRIEDYLKWDHE